MSTKKLVKESLNEVISFERGGDPISKLGIGKKQLIKDWLEKMDIRNYTINDDFSIDVKECIGVDLSDHYLDKFPDYIQFNEIYGYFDCEHCNLTSLRGSPRKVFGYFSCIDNNLTSLEGCPTFVGDDFYCAQNPGKFTEKDIKKLCYVIREIIIF